MNLLSFSFHLIIASNEWVIVHLIMFLFTSKPGSVTNPSSFTKVLPKFDQTFQDNEQIFMQLLWFIFSYDKIKISFHIHFKIRIPLLNSCSNYMLNFMLYSILIGITSNYKLYVITYNYNHYVIMDGLVRTISNQHRKSWNFSFYLYAIIFLTICTFIIAHPELRIVLFVALTWYFKSFKL